MFPLLGEGFRTFREVLDLKIWTLSEISVLGGGLQIPEIEDLASIVRMLLVHDS